jgi:hypothetical protein
VSGGPGSPRWLLRRRHHLDLDSQPAGTDSAPGPSAAALHCRNQVLQPSINLAVVVPAINPAGQAMVSWDLSQLHRMLPDEAAQMTTFTIATGNSSTVYRVGGSADESPGRLRLCPLCSPGALSQRAAGLLRGRAGARGQSTKAATLAHHASIPLAYSGRCGGHRREQQARQRHRRRRRRVRGQRWRHIPGAGVAHGGAPAAAGDGAPPSAPCLLPCSALAPGGRRARLAAGA